VTGEFESQLVIDAAVQTARYGRTGGQIAVPVFDLDRSRALFV
jgi:hypothetical protein